MNPNRLMERARLTSIIQRLRKVLGDQETLAILHLVIAAEFRDQLNKCNEKDQSQTSITSPTSRQ